MLMQDMTSLLNLVPVEGAAELYVLLGFVLLHLEVFQPSRLVLIDSNVKFL